MHAAAQGIEVGRIEAIFRYPVKSMRGHGLDAATVGWHGLEGDRRFALRRVGDRGGMPWLTASKLPELILFTPTATGADPDVPTHVRTPEGDELPLLGEALAAEVTRRYGSPVEMMHLRHGIFDDGIISAITSSTAAEVCRLAAQPADVRRFRPNIVVRSVRPVPFEEDGWLGGVLVFGDGDDAPAVAVSMRDERCAMVNFDPDGATRHAPEVMKAVVKANGNHAGIYGVVVRVGRLAVGQTIRLHQKRRASSPSVVV